MSPQTVIKPACNVGESCTVIESTMQSPSDNNCEDGGTRRVSRNFTVKEQIPFC